MAVPAGARTAPGPDQLLVRGLTRAGVVLVAGGLGLLVWHALILAGMPATFRGRAVPPGMSLLTRLPARQLVDQRLGSSLAVLALALVLGALVGFAAVWLRAVLGRAHAEAGRTGGAVGWLVGMLWTPPVPVAMTAVLLVLGFRVGHGVGARTWVLTVALGGVVAWLVAVTVGDRWVRGAWLAGLLAGVAGAGRALAAITGALVVGETLVNQPGVGSLLVRSVITPDRYVVVAAVAILLVVALVGQVVSALAGALADWLDAAAVPAASGRSSPATGQVVAALATLVVPVLVLAGSVVAGDATAVNVAHVSAGPSSAHLLGTDMLGRDVLARLLVGYRQTWLVALAAVVLAGVVGVAWGALAVLVARRLPRAGGPVAEALLAPGRLVMVAPLLLAGIVLAGADRWPVVVALAVALAPRVAASVTDLARPLPASARATIRTAIGVLLSAWGVALVVLVGLHVLGVGTHPPAPTLGGVLTEGLAYLTVSSQIVFAALVALVATAPFLLAGWALSRHPRQAEAVTTLDA